MTRRSLSSVFPLFILIFFFFGFAFRSLTFFCVIIARCLVVIILVFFLFLLNMHLSAVTSATNDVNITNGVINCVRVCVCFVC